MKKSLPGETGHLVRVLVVDYTLSCLAVPPSAMTEQVSDFDDRAQPKTDRDLQRASYD